MQTLKRFRQAFVVTCQAAEACHPTETALHNPPSRQEHEPSFSLRQLHHFQLNAFFLSSLCRIVTRVALVYKRHLHTLPSSLLHSLRQLSHLCSVTRVRRGYVQGQQVPQSVHSHVYFAAFALLGSIISTTSTAFRTALQGAAVEYGSRGLSLASLNHPQHLSQIVYHSLEDLCLDPALGLFVDDVPGWQVIRHHTPGGTRPHNVAQSIEHLSQFIHSLWGFLCHQRQVWSYECPLIVTHVARVCFAFHTLILSTSSPKVHNTLYITNINYTNSINPPRLVNLPSQHMFTMKESNRRNHCQQ